MKKICKKCGLFACCYFFIKNRNICKKCHSKRDKIYREKQKEKRKLSSKRYYKNNKEIIKYKTKTYYKCNKESILNSLQSSRSKNPLKYMYADAKYRAKKNDLPFLIKIYDLSIPKDFLCPLLKILMRRCAGNSSDNSMTIDRIVPEKGYVPNNVWVVSRKANANYNSPTLDRIIPDKGYVPDNIMVVSFKANTIKNNLYISEMKVLLDNWKKKIQEIKTENQNRKNK